MTLCFVLYPFDFGVFTIHFCILCTMLHILNGAILRGRAKMENKQGKKDENISILIRSS